jgi:alcohol dehydrogenase (cytochrome c)
MIRFGVLELCVLAASAALSFGQAPDTGRIVYETRCAICHGGDGKGGEYAPSILPGIAARGDPELTSVISSGIPSKGMPRFSFVVTEMAPLLSHLRSLAKGAVPAPKPIVVKTVSGESLQGTVVGEGIADLQLRTADGRIRLLRSEGDRYRTVTSQTDWPMYDGQYSGNRYSELRQISKENVARLAPLWTVTISGTTPLEGTPVVVEGMMYVTTANQCYALDAGTGREIWRFQHPKARSGTALAGVNRGAAVAGDRVFMVTDHAHLLALNRFTGALQWETEMGGTGYSANSAPLAIDDLVVSGLGGGDSGARGYIAAYDQKSGVERWRFWTVPAPGEPGSETWRGKTIEHPGAATWFTGSYDPDLGVVYWQTGNPGSDHNGDERQGDNLYSCSVVALDAKTGKLKWYYQFTPHDLWDWDAQEPLLLVNADWQGRPRKLLLQANRNGFFYVLDRTSGELLLGKPFVQKLTWAKEIGKDGRPVLNPDQAPTAEGTRVCPSLIGAANWWSNSYHPRTGLFYVQSLESCAIYTKRDQEWQAGKSFMNGSTRQPPGERLQKILRAIDVKTGAIAWEVPQKGPGASRGGTLATAGGIVFFCDDSNAFRAVDAATGSPLWYFPTNHHFRASPMTYVFDQRQYVAVAVGPNVIAFGLPPNAGGSKPAP